MVSSESNPCPWLLIVSSHMRHTECADVLSHDGQHPSPSRVCLSSCFSTLDCAVAMLADVVCNTFVSVPGEVAAVSSHLCNACRDVSDRALRVLCKEAVKYSEVRSRLPALQGLQAAALFQQGLRQQSSPTQSPSPAGAAPEGITTLQHANASSWNWQNVFWSLF